MRWLLAPLMVIANPATAQARPSSADASEILRVVLAFEVRVHAAATVGPPPCVRRELGRPPFGGSYARVREWEEWERRPLPPRSARRPFPQVVTVVDSAELRFSPFLPEWRRPSAVNPGYVGSGGEMAIAEQRRLRRAERAAMMAPVQAAPVRSIEPQWLGPPLAICSAHHPEFPRLEISAPTSIGNVAFVVADFHCVMCSQGIVFALRRSGRSWKIVGNSQPWVS